jgi:hypothetical protein
MSEDPTRRREEGGQRPDWEQSGEGWSQNDPGQGGWQQDQGGWQQQQDQGGWGQQGQGQGGWDQGQGQGQGGWGQDQGQGGWQQQPPPPPQQPGGWGQDQAGWGQQGQPGWGQQGQPGWQQPPPPQDWSGGGQQNWSGGGPAPQNRSWVGVVVLVAVLVVVGIGFFLFNQLGNRGDDGLAEGGQETSIFDVEVGDCYVNPPSGEVEGLTLVDCVQTHDAEIFALIDHPAGPGDPFIGSAEMETFAQQACIGQAFTDYVGLPYEQSIYYVNTIYPTEGTWVDGDREVVCSLVTGDGSPLPGGSARGANQ